jgi:hypothetical protein
MDRPPEKYGSCQLNSEAVGPDGETAESKVLPAGKSENTVDVKCGAVNQEWTTAVANGRPSIARGRLPPRIDERQPRWTTAGHEWTAAAANGRLPRRMDDRRREWTTVNRKWTTAGRDAFPATAIALPPAKLCSNRWPIAFRRG